MQPMLNMKAGYGTSSSGPMDEGSAERAMAATKAVVAAVGHYASAKRGGSEAGTFWELWCDAAEQGALRALGVNDDNVYDVLEQLPDDEIYVIFY